MLLLATAAWALTLSADPAFDVADDVTGVAVSGSAVLLLTPDRVDVADASGTLGDTWPGAAVAAVGTTAGTLVCGPGGLRLEPGAGLLDATPCAAVVVTDDGWATDQTRGYADGSTTPLGLVFAGTPLLAWAGRIGGASVGDTGIATDAGDTVATGGPVVSLGVRDGLFLWARGDTAALGDEAGATVTLSAAPSWVGVGDLDGDGSEDVVVREDGALGVVDGATGTETNFPFSVDAAAVGDLDGDGCDDLVVLVGGQGEVLRAAECGASDEDDCDLPTTVTIEADGDLTEDAEVGFYASADGCVDDWEWSWWGSAEADCTQTSGLRCTFGSSGDFHAQATAIVDGSAYASGVYDGEVWGLSPTISAAVGYACDAPDTTSVQEYVGDEVSFFLHVEEDGEEHSFTCSASGLPPGVEITPDCDVTGRYTSEDVGTWNVQLTAVDEDGDVGTGELSLTVIERHCGECGCCGGHGALLFLLFAGGAVRRRRG